ncbi:MAG: DUF6702 family protein [Flavobacteriaceae bacterium]|nr:hypothetical protein [Flavobacteriaceae bacterium]
MNFSKIILLLIIPILTAANVHKFYVSTTKVEYVQEKQSLQIITKLFIDDIEDVLQERYNTSLGLATQKEAKEAEAFLKKYALQKFKIWVDGKEASITYVGREYEVDVVKIYLESEDISEFKNIEIENKMLFEISPEQQNIIHVKNKDSKKSLILDKENPKGLLNFH